MGGRLTKIVLSLPVLIVAGLFGLYLIAGFFLVDPLAQKLLPWVGFPNSSPSKDRKERWKQYEVFYEQDRYQTHINQLDSKYFKDGVELTS